VTSTEAIAERRDEKLGLREVFAFIGESGDRVAVMSHIPLAPAGRTVVICSSILGDLPKNYRREVGLGRTLASQGITALRFHYRGTGNSDRDSAFTTFKSMCEDAISVVGEFSGDGPVAFVGTRIGALVAANAAAAFPGAPLALVEPVAEAAQFYREGFRARMMRDLKDQVADKPSSEKLLAELEERGVLDVFGYPLDANLYHSTSELRLDHEIPSDQRPIFLLQLGGSETRSDYARIAEKHSDRTPPLEMDLEGQADAWWFLDDQQPSIESGLETVAEWLATSLREGQ
jgi:pimeloyl-ACP methyl ester carboxylesterase